MKPMPLTLAVPLLALPLLLAGPAAATAPAVPHAHVPAIAAEAAARAPVAPQLQQALRDLWHGHVVATRDYALAVEVADAAAVRKAADAVVANAGDIANAVGGFYGDAAGKQMLTLLGGHWGAVKALTDARHDGDAAAAQAAMDELVANADAIAVFLGGANPYLPADAVRGLLVAHGGHHAAQIQQIMAGDMAGEAKTWQAMQAHMDVIADALAAAIARQFPDRAS